MIGRLDIGVAMRLRAMAFSSIEFSISSGQMPVSICEMVWDKLWEATKEIGAVGSELSFLSEGW